MLIYLLGNFFSKVWGLGGGGPGPPQPKGSFVLVWEKDRNIIRQQMEETKSKTKAVARDKNQKNSG